MSGSDRFAPTPALPLKGEGAAPPDRVAVSKELRRMGKETFFTAHSLAHARRLRRDMTEVEKKLWRFLRGKNIDGFKFRKQVPIGSYIADFVCMQAKLIVELDGGQHVENMAYDVQRTEYLKRVGFRVLRFWNHEVNENLEGVLEMIGASLSAPAEIFPPPLRGEDGRGAPVHISSNIEARI